MAPSAPDPRHGEGRAWRASLWLYFVVPLVVLAVVGGVIWWLRAQGRTVTLATGSSGGTYAVLGRGVADVLSAGLPRTSVRAAETTGSGLNMRLLEAGEVELAFVQNDTPGGTEVRSVARLYDEVLQVVVPADAGIVSLADLAGRRVAVGPSESGTAAVVERLVRHFGVTWEQFSPSELSAEEAAEALERGDVDAAFFLAGLPTPAVARLLADGRFALLSFGDPAAPGSTLEGLHVHLPFHRPAVVPRATYGRLPAEPVGTLAIAALLVTRADVPDRFVYDVTRLLFASRVRLIDAHRSAAHLSDRVDVRGLRFGWHPGAADYYHRNKPGFLVVYAEVFSLLATLAFGIGSMLLGLREWVRRVRKNRIDVYYLEVQRIADDLGPELSAQELLERRGSLCSARRRAFSDLVAERLEAEESFSILVHFLESQVQEIDDLLEREGEPEEAP